MIGLKIGDTVMARWDNWAYPIMGFVTEEFGQRYEDSTWISVFHNGCVSSMTPDYYPVHICRNRMVLTEKCNNMLRGYRYRHM